MQAKRKKRVLHLVTGLEVGGTETMLLKTVPRMQDELENRICALIGHGPMGPKLEQAGVPVHYLALRGLWDIGIIWRFRRVIREFEPDIVVTYLIHSDLFGRIFARLFGVKRVVSSQRGSLLNWEFLRGADRLTKRLVNQYIVQTEIAKRELMTKLRLPARKFVVIPNGLELDGFTVRVDKSAKRREVGVPTNATVLTCVSRLRVGKGHDYLLPAFDDLADRHPQAHLLLVGGGEIADDVAKQARACRHGDRIHLLGDRSDVREILAASDVFVFPSRGEGMSNAVMEAMASGLPCVVSDIEANRVLVTHKATGMLFATGDSGDLVQKLESVLTESNLAQKLGGAARRHVTETYDIMKVVHQLTTVLKHV